MNRLIRDDRLRLGAVVIVALAILTAIEFWAAVGLDTGANLVLVILMVAKAVLILEYFMHMSQLSRPSEEGH